MQVTCDSIQKYEMNLKFIILLNVYMGNPNVIIWSNKFTSDIFNNFISSFLKIFYYIFFFSKKGEKRGVYGDINRNIKWNHKKRWPHLIEHVPHCLIVPLLQQKKEKLRLDSGLGTWAWAEQGYSDDHVNDHIYIYIYIYMLVISRIRFYSRGTSFILWLVELIGFYIEI